MKKFASLAAAGTILLSSASIALAGGPSHHSWPTVTNQGNYGTKTAVVSVAGSNSGLNSQMGKGSQTMNTGTAYAESGVMSVANQNGTNGTGNVNQKNMGTKTFVASGALSNSGLNKQVSMGGSNNYSFGHHHSSQSQTQTMNTGAAGSSSYVESWANINLNGVQLD